MATTFTILHDRKVVAVLLFQTLEYILHGCFHHRPYILFCGSLLLALHVLLIHPTLGRMKNLRRGVAIQIHGRVVVRDLFVKLLHQ